MDMEIEWRNWRKWWGASLGCNCDSAMCTIPRHRTSCSSPTYFTSSISTITTSWYCGCATIRIHGSIAYTVSTILLPLRGCGYDGCSSCNCMATFKHGCFYLFHREHVD